MRFLWLSMLKDLCRYRRDAAALALWFVLPLVITGMIGLVFGRGDSVPQGLLLIADEDQGMAGTFLRESISRGPLGAMLAIQQVAQADGRRRMANGDAAALVKSAIATVDSAVSKGILKRRTASRYVSRLATRQPN